MVIRFRPQKHCVILSEHSEREDPGVSNLPKALNFLTKKSASPDTINPKSRRSVSEDGWILTLAMLAQDDTEPYFQDYKQCFFEKKIKN